MSFLGITAALPSVATSHGYPPSGFMSHYGLSRDKLARRSQIQFITNQLGQHSDNLMPINWRVLFKILPSLPPLFLFSSFLTVHKAVTVSKTLSKHFTLYLHFELR